MPKTKTTIVTAFDRETALRLRGDLAAALRSVSDVYGVEIVITSTRFDAYQVAFRVEAKTKASKVRDLTDFLSTARLNGLDPDRVGPEGEKLVAFNRRARATPWVFDRGGRRFACDSATARAYFGEREEKEHSR